MGKGQWLSFEPGMGYVALSRVRSLAGLSLVGMNEIALKINEEVFEQDKQFIDSSHEHADDLRNMSTKEITNNQEKYIKSIGGVLKGKIKKNITKKISTIDETKKLFEQGKTIKEMCSIRGVTANTIFNHLEKIKEEDPEINFSYLTKTVSKTKQIKIRAALMSVGTTNGKYLLSPVKTYLGDKFTFDEIRLIRLIMD
ncbi:MAG: helix-turn-helix domain-containing protein [bacterium]